LYLLYSFQNGLRPFVAIEIGNTTLVFSRVVALAGAAGVVAVALAGAAGVVAVALAGAAGVVAVALAGAAGVVAAALAGALTAA
jgi:hypothetical protein